MLVKGNTGELALTITVPDRLLAPITYAIYKEIAERIEAGDPLAKELVDWYATSIGISAKSLKQALERKEVNEWA